MILTLWILSILTLSDNLWALYTDYLYYRVIINSGGGVVHIFLIIITCHLLLRTRYCYSPNGYKFIIISY